MENAIVNEIDPSTGITYSYSLMTFGNKNMKMNQPKIYSNLHIILEKKNKMIFSLIKLVNQTNYDLKMRNKNLTNIIIDLENNLLELFYNYDYSNLFRDHLDLIIEQINYLNEHIFDELIKLIYSVYDNYSIILQDVENEKYDIFQIIRNITKNEYTEYIYNMNDILEIFHNHTLHFLEQIEDEINNLTHIEKMDFLYDILDSIYDCKLILKQFNKYLFKSIEKGILVFEIDINDFIENIIGDLLYIIDYFSININKNQLLMKSYNETERIKLTSKLKPIREIVDIIFEKLLINIKADYNFEMSIDNNKSIRFFSENKSKTFFDETERRAYDITENIKSKISYMNLFEIYKDNLDFINYIQNKSIIELIETSYNNITMNILSVDREYLNKNSDINIKKTNLFNTSKLIINEINNEIKEISLYIKSYLESYKEQNIYNIHYNLYKINEFFIEEELKNIFDEYKNIINDTIEMHIKSLDYNYNLLFSYLNDLEYHILVVHEGERTYIGQGFLEKYTQFIDYFSQYISLINNGNSEIFTNLENNYNKIKNDIFNYVKNKLLTINNYGYETNKYKDDFYFISRMNSKLLSIFENCNQYFTIERFSLLKRIPRVTMFINGENGLEK